MRNIIQNLKVGISGVRGVIGETLTMQLITAFSATFGTYLGKGRILVGRDTRPTGPMIELAVTSGLLSVGCQPCLTGIVPTPTLQILVDHMNTIGGIAITASHNPIQWNALKFVGSNGIFLTAAEAKDLLDNYYQMNVNYVSEREIRSEKIIKNAFEIHQKRIFQSINVEAIRQCKFKVAVDCCNGVGVRYSRPFLEDLGCSVVTIFDEEKGYFEREPEPTPSNLGLLSKKVQEEGCQLGFAQDPDGDRLAIVNSAGEPIGENYTLVLAIKHGLSKEKGPVVVSVVTSTAAEKVTLEAGCDFHYAKIGEINVTSKMFEMKAAIGGESNGGVIWPKVHHCRDSFSAMALILEMMAIQEKSLEELLENIPRYYTTTRKVESSEEQALHIVHCFRNEYTSCKLNLIDGIKIHWEDKWVIIRPSNTEPIIRVMSEALSQEESDRLAEEFAERCKEMIHKPNTG